MIITNPTTEKPIREVREDDASSIARKFDCARGSQSGWARTPLPERLAIVRRFAALLASRVRAFDAMTGDVRFVDADATPAGPVRSSRASSRRSGPRASSSTRRSPRSRWSEPG